MKSYSQLLSDTKETLDWACSVYLDQQANISRRNTCLQTLLFSTVVAIGLPLAKVNLEALKPYGKVIDLASEASMCIVALSICGSVTFEQFAKENAQEEKEALQELQQDLLTLTIEQPAHQLPTTWENRTQNGDGKRTQMTKNHNYSS